MNAPAEFPFTLPRGYVDADGAVHREGTMRLATAFDEIGPLKEPKALSISSADGVRKASP